MGYQEDEARNSTTSKKSPSCSSSSAPPFSSCFAGFLWSLPRHSHSHSHSQLSFLTSFLLPVSFPRVGFSNPCFGSFTEFVSMASSHAVLGVSASSSLCNSAFLSGSNASRLLRRVPASPCASPARALKIEAKGEWLPGLASPSYLNGSLPGDNGFDPLGLAEDPENLKWYVQAELQNGRWAMLGVAGMLIPEALTKIGLINAPEWYDAGKVEYFAPASTLFVIEFILFHYVEIRRWQDIKYPGSVNADPFNPSLKLPPGEVGYPGGIFNPLNFPTSLEYKEKEIANGRLAMLAFLGFVIQHNLTGKGPLENLAQHLSDPWHNTIVQTLQGL